MLCLSDSQPDSARQKNVPGPIRAALRVARHSVSLKNVPGPIRSSRHSLVRWRYPKNVLGPIAASTSVLDALNRSEQRSWTHLAVALHPHQTVSNLKNVPGPIRRSLRSLATDHAYRNNVRRPIGNSLQVPG